MISALLTACGPGTSALRPASEPSPAGDVSESRTVVIATNAEPVFLARRGLERIGGAPTLFDAGLTQSAGQGTPTELELAEGFPQLNTDSWKVLTDGKMETTWRLRPNLKWHDGTPLTADDFAFGFQVYRLPEFDGPRLAGGFIDNVTAPDLRTVVIHWKSPYPDAAEDIGTVPALPRHLLAAPFERLDSETFKALPYWKTEFIGLGPYKLDTWEPGAFIEGSAFSDYAFGKPKIGHVKLVWIADGSALVANMLAGSVHFATAAVLEFEQAVVLRRQWRADSGGSIALNPTKIRYVQVQYKTEYTQPAAILDLRVRQALNHAIDKQALVDGMLEGE